MELGDHDVVVGLAQHPHCLPVCVILEVVALGVQLLQPLPRLVLRSLEILVDV